jgi:hypothetical protein
MVSTFRYRSVKGIDTSRRVSYRVAVPISAVLLVLYYAPYAFFLTLTLVYALSGPAIWLWGRFRRGGPTRLAPLATDTPEDARSEILPPPSPPRDDIPYRR